MSKRLVILGGGESGTGTALLGKAKGYDVFLSDRGEIKENYAQELNDASIAFEQGGHSEEKILNADIVVKSPGIPETAPLVVALKSKGIPVVSEMEFAFPYNTAKTICITGSNGKTTTTLLTYHLLKEAGVKVGLGGNVGKSFARQLIQDQPDWFVLELSSFQLDGMFAFRADIAILTNITPDHLDRYDYQMEKYVAAKFRIAQNQTAEQFFIYSQDDPETQRYLSQHTIGATMIPFTLRDVPEGEEFEGAFVQNENINININKHPVIMKIASLALKGKHNVNNSMAAGVAARILDLRKEIVRESLENFENVEHRLEFVSKVHGISFINDSKATNVNSAWYALESINTPIIWVAGGQDKGNDYSELLALVSKRVKAIICLTKDSSKIRKAFEGVVDTIIDSNSADHTVRVAYELAKEGDTVLLSPACASFDLFENYEDRGRQFKKAVKSL
ncbi:MAG: UDP-N-acetylmuramoyl-L-alanine--D-glutamate ligase [Bacteroidota bacterium]